MKQIALALARGGSGGGNSMGFSSESGSSVSTVSSMVGSSTSVTDIAPVGLTDRGRAEPGWPYPLSFPLAEPAVNGSLADSPVAVPAAVVAVSSERRSQ